MTPEHIINIVTDSFDGVVPKASWGDVCTTRHTAFS